jgi:UDP-2-acetamido-3-amino-2,3-dideoxy-glucuronate N-acetyltransferase
MKDIFVHPTAVIDDGASIDSGTKIWHWTHISEEAIIGKNCNFGQNIFVGNKVKIGSNVKVQNNVSIYDNITIEDNVFCGPSMVFTNVINPRAFIERKDEYKSTLLQEGCSIGANATVLCGVTLGKYCLVGAGSVVTKSVKDFALVMGVPGKQVGWVSKFGKSILIPDNVKEFNYTCPDTGDNYHFDGENLFLVS